MQDPRPVLRAIVCVLNVISSNSTAATLHVPTARTFQERDDDGSHSTSRRGRLGIRPLDIQSRHCSSPAATGGSFAARDRTPSPRLSRDDCRHVSYRNECNFCQLSHSGAAAAHLDGNYDLVECQDNPEPPRLSDKAEGTTEHAGKV